MFKFRVLNRRILSNRGFSLLETIVAIVVSAILFGGLTAYIAGSLKRVARTSQKVNVVSLQSAVAAAMQIPDSCFNNLVTINLGATPNFNLTSLKDFDESGTAISTIISALNTELSTTVPLKVTSIRMTGPGAVGNPVMLSTVGSERNYLSDLVITLAPHEGVIFKPIVVPSILLVTNLAGTLLTCYFEQTGSSAATCSTLGLVWDNVNSVCVPKPDRSCASMGGVYNILTSKCEITPNLTMTCPANEAVNRIVNGVPTCEPVSGGIWSDFGGCVAACGAGTQTRSCLVGTCVGPATQGCVYYSPPVMTCGFTLVDKIGDPPLTCGGGGGDFILCSATSCPPAGSRGWWNPQCDYMYTGGSSGPAY